MPRQVKVGDVLYREGEGDCDFFVIVEGKVALIEDSGASEQVIGIHGPRRFLGELGLITGQRVSCRRWLSSPARCSSSLWTGCARSSPKIRSSATRFCAR